ncbi:hydroxymyristoyl-ACP dehydratase [Croceitalea sp. P059]|uniref:3-hydroxyacyl-ACP dehydratase FabZ family protein n=1 Tax=Croceitalea sp. P059 TaxID=3075601 RepID=UPI0028887530|nr:hydroxymyristoyl-ACP dehydratase [Croceitalea sp. P059]MDT0539775.1 hydroxymyristoyl-ACP dehydratase [Croceitalea sp. P059]
MTHKNEFSYIKKHLPYQEPFLFVGELRQVTENGVQGDYTFAKEADFYKGHFKNHPVTPGVILTECCAQIGLVCLGIFLLNDQQQKPLQIGFTSAEMEFLKPVYPGEKVQVVSEKVYFRFQKLKCKVKMYNQEEELVCKGLLSGMFKATPNEK